PAERADEAADAGDAARCAAPGEDRCRARVTAFERRSPRGPGLPRTRGVSRRQRDAVLDRFGEKRWGAGDSAAPDGPKRPPEACEIRHRRAGARFGMVANTSQ